MLPSFSIVTPSFNHAPYVEAAAGSVLSQKYPQVEYWVIDAVSTDGTQEILRKFGPELNWICEPDRGQADAINKGFAKTRGQILGWLNSDDMYAAGALQAVAEIFAANAEVGVVYGDADFIDALGNPIAPCAHIEPFSAHCLLRYSDYLVQPAVFFRRELFESAGGLDPTLNWAMDYDLWLKFATRTKFFYLPKLLAHYRWLGDSKTASAGADRIEEVRRVAVRHGSRGLPAFFHLEAVRMHMARSLADARRGKLLDAVAQFARAGAFLVSSPRAVASLFSPRTWRIIRTGQKLRNRVAVTKA